MTRGDDGTAGGHEQRRVDAATDADATQQDASQHDPELAEKQAMVDKLFRHTNAFLAEHRDDPLLVVEALAAIVVRYAALLGPVEQLPARLAVLKDLIAQECAAVQAIAKTAAWDKQRTSE